MFTISLNFYKITRLCIWQENTLWICGVTMCCLYQRSLIRCQRKLYSSKQAFVDAYSSNM